MKRDPNKVVDASKERHVDWDREVKEGNLSRVTGLTRSTSDPSFQHIQGRPMSDVEAQARVVPASTMQIVAQTGRYPQSSGRSTFCGGWPDLKKEEPTS